MAMNSYIYTQSFDKMILLMKRQFIFNKIFHVWARATSNPAQAKNHAE